MLLTGLEAAFALEDRESIEELLRIIEGTPLGKRPQFLHAHASRFRARLAASSGEPDEAEQLFKSAAGLLREIEAPFYMAVTLLEHGEWLVDRGRAGQATPLLTEAQGVFERLKARPWLERLDRSSSAELESASES